MDVGDFYIKSLKKLEQKIDNYYLPNLLKGSRHNLKRIIEFPSQSIAKLITRFVFNEYIDTKINGSENLSTKGSKMVVSHHAMPMIGNFLGGYF